MKGDIPVNEQYKYTHLWLANLKYGTWTQITEIAHSMLLSTFTTSHTPLDSHQSLFDIFVQPEDADRAEALLHAA